MPWHSQKEEDEAPRSIQMQRELFQAQPPGRQRETLERVRLLLAAEVERKQAQPSYLKRIAPDVYGIKVR